MKMYFLSFILKMKTNEKTEGKSEDGISLTYTVLRIKSIPIFSFYVYYCSLKHIPIFDLCKLEF